MLHFRAAFSLFFLILLASVEAQGDPGDTTWVQTFTWEAQDNPATAYDSPGRRWFQFPSGEDTTYRKILMYHRLKCFENGTAGNLGYPCGEWDYLTYNWLFDHTGMYDSTALTHPQYLLNDASFDAATLILNPEGGQPADTIIRVLQTAHHEFVGGSDTWSELQGEPSTELLSSALGDGVRHQWLWTADELDALGWENGNVAWRMSLPRAGNLSAASVARATLRARWTTATALDGIVTSGWLTLVDGPVAANDMQWAWELDFVQALTREEGMNLLLDLSLDGVVSGQGEEVAIQAFEVADTLAQTCNPLAPGAAQYVHMNGGDRMELDPSELLALDTTVTVECWIRGDAAVMPANTTLFEGVNASDQREMNVHAPWSNGRVYWDCGFDGGYDRIDEAAQAGLYEGNWVHWAFTKDASTGVMKMFVNGALWHSGGGKDHLIGEIVRMNLGGSAWATNDYYGDVAAFRVWDVALSGAILSEWMDRASLDALLEHPHADRLLGAVNMLGYDGEVTDQGALAGWIHGDAARRAFEPREAFLDAAPAELRPALVLEGGAMPLTAVGEALWAEAVPVPPMSVTEWEVVGNDVEWIDLHYGWDASLVTSVTTEWGDTLATYELQGEQVNYNGGELTYWSAPFEVVDRYELARYITPYGINLTLGPDGWAWVFDVTDYAPLLRDSVELEAGNWQELLDLKFAFIEGTPARDVENVTAFWKGLHYLSNWDETILPVTYTPGEGEEQWRLKTRASGHDFGQGNNCAEFCYNTHSVNVNGEEEWSWEIMQECADNPLYPQGGTWIYDRAGWCPGAPVKTQDFELTPLVAGQDSFTVEYDITYDPFGNYRMEGQIIGYGAPNLAHDVEIMDILAPNDDKLLSRLNPVCENPVVLIRNNGTEPLGSVTFTYGITGESLATEVVTFDEPLAFLESREVELPYDASPYYVGDDEETLRFEVQVEVADATDEEPSNGWMSTTFRRPPTWQYTNLDDNRMIVWTKTNNVPGETTVEIRHANGNLYWARSYSEANTTYRDTIVLNQGCYRFTVNDSGDDGIDFWANNDGSGYVRLKRVSGGNFHIFESDFGKSISQAFYFATNLYSNVEELEASGDLAVFPNPVNETLTLLPAGWSGNAEWEVYGVHGQLLDHGTWWSQSGMRSSLDASAWPSGTLVVVVRHNDSKWARWVVKE
ncbi:MAG: LamG-like jellyroll fold domain-containing protein [Flavobacteriales bacterium]